MGLKGGLNVNVIHFTEYFCPFYFNLISVSFFLFFMGGHEARDPLKEWNWGIDDDNDKNDITNCYAEVLC